MKDDEFIGTFVFGFLVAGFLGLMAWTITEASCQRSNDVYDCEWSRTPFTPVVPDVGG